MILTTKKAWSESYEAGVGRTLTRTFDVELTAAEQKWDPSAIRAAAEVLGLPIPNVTIVDGLLCKTCHSSHSENAQNLAVYTAQCDNRFVSPQQQQRQDEPNPLNWKPFVKVRGNLIEMPVDQDRDGKAITNSAKVRPLNRVTIPETEAGFEITCTLSTIPSWFFGYKRTQSSGTTKIWVIPPYGSYAGLYYSAPTRTLRYMPDPNSIVTDRWNGIDYVQATFRLDVVNPQKLQIYGDTIPTEYSTWNHSLAFVDCGFTYRYYDSGLAQYVHRKCTIGQNGEEPREEMLLNGQGGYDPDHQTPDDARHIVPLVYKDQAYTSLPGCSA